MLTILSVTITKNAFSSNEQKATSAHLARNEPRFRPKVIWFYDGPDNAIFLMTEPSLMKNKYIHQTKHSDELIARSRGSFAPFSGPFVK